MHTGYISFCDHLGLNIKSHEVKERIVRDLQEKYSAKIVQRHHERLEAPGLARLQKNPHLVCLRSNGNPYFLFLTRCQHVNQCIFIDKKIQSGYFVPRMILSKLRFDDELFEDTLIDGEMITQAGKWVFLAHDLLVLKGHRLDNDTIVKRIQLFHDLLDTGFRPDPTDVCSIQVKTYVTYERIRYLVEELMPALPYTCRGLYFKPLYIKITDVLYNFDDSLIKKVERVKYQSESDTFHDSTNLAGLKRVTPPTTPIAANAANAGNSVLPTTAAPVAAATIPLAPVAHANPAIPVESPTSTKMLIEKTHTVDVYNVFDPKTKARIGIAAVTTLKMSRQMQLMFKAVGLQARLLLPCQYHERFQKWLPILPESREPSASILESC